MKNLFLIIAVLATITTSAQNFNKAKLDSLFTAIDTNKKGMGSVSVFEKGKEIYTNAIGFADVENKIKNSSKTKFQIGSISKTFTATIIMKLVEEGKLKLDTKLSDFFPEIINSKEITIEHLLRHRSGIFNYTNSPDFGNYMFKNTSRKLLLKKIIELGNVFKPNEKYEYSNSNYILLTWIIEDITNKEYATILDNYIVKPLKLTNTYFNSNVTKKDDEAYSYTTLIEQNKEPNWNSSVTLGAGGIISNATDLNIFITSLFSGKLISKSSFDLMKKTEDSYGLGIFQVPFNEKKGYGHNGRIAGFNSALYNFDSDNVSVAYLSNDQVLPVNDIIIGVLSIYFNREYKIPTFKTLELKTEELDPYLGTYSKVDFPIKITVTKKGNQLIGQIIGQPKFILEPYKKDKFKIDVVSAKIEFVRETNTFILKQNGQVLEFKKQ